MKGVKKWYTGKKNKSLFKTKKRTSKKSGCMFVVLIALAVFTYLIVALATPTNAQNKATEAKKYNIYNCNNAKYIQKIEQNKQLKSAYVVRDVVKDIIYFKNGCLIVLKEFGDNINLVAIIDEPLKLNIGDYIEATCFYCSELVPSTEDKKLPAYLAIKINKIVGRDARGLAVADEFVIGSIENITQAHKKNVVNPNSKVRLNYKGRIISIEYVLARLNKFIKNKQKEVVLELTNTEGTCFLKDIHDESVFDKLLGKQPQPK